MSVLPRLAATSLSAVLAFGVLGGSSAAFAAPGPDAPSARTGPGAPAVAVEVAQGPAASAGSAGGAVAGRSAAGRPEALPTPAAAGGLKAADTRGSSTGAAQRERADATPARATKRLTGAKASKASNASNASKASKASKAAKAAKAATAAQAAQRHAARAKAAQAAERAKAAKADAAKAGKPATGARPAQPGKPAKADRPTATSTGDPRGNNGTFKVDGPVLDTSHGNEPQVECAFRLNFFGYDDGQLADISFTAIAPTSGPTTTVSGRPIISTTAAQGGVYGGSYPATGTWTAADLGLDPTVRQHVKVSVESVNADGSPVPGGAKHKVFWLEPCAAAAAAVTTASVPATVTTASLPATVTTASLPATVTGPVAAPRSLTGAPSAEAVTAAPAAGQVAPASAVLGAGVTAQAAQRPTVVAAPVLAAITLPQGSARTAVQPAALPFTGSPQLLALLLGGIVALAGGTALLVAVRRTA